MDKETEAFILDIMNSEKDLTLATLREDGYPQATTVSYANDGLRIYVVIGKDSQKAKNIKRCEKVSLTIDADYDDWNKIKGLSMAAKAQVLTDPKEIEHAFDCLAKKFPQAAEWGKPEELADLAVLKVTPEVVSVLNYQKGFGHTDLVEV